MKSTLTIRIAVRALNRNLLRALLTTLGIVIGVSAVITMMQIGAGSSASIREKITSMGANVLIVIPKAAESGGVSIGAGSAMTLTPQDCAVVRQHCPSLRNAAPVVKARAQAVNGNQNWVPDSIEGTTPEYLDVRQWSIEEGAAFTHLDVTRANKVCLLGRTVADKLFGKTSPLGRQIRVRNVSLRVIGVLSQKGANLMGQDQDDTLLAPWTTIKYRIAGSRLEDVNQSTDAENSGVYPGSARTLYPGQSDTYKSSNRPLCRFVNVDAIMAVVRNSGLVKQAGEEIAEVLRSRHRIGPGAKDDFEIINLSEITRMLSSTTSLMTNLLLSIAAISLVVGGVGIMNIMLVSVTERTREIGLRMAVGARSRDILKQFLFEALALCLAGAAMGMVLGNTVSFFVWRLLRWPVEASPMAMVTAVLVSMGVAILFGFYPAWKASRLDPIVALRHE
jgi:ABC-type antimicrobial peptide transport system permease subunit